MSRPTPADYYGTERWWNRRSAPERGDKKQTLKSRKDAGKVEDECGVDLVLFSCSAYKVRDFASIIFQQRNSAEDIFLALLPILQELPALEGDIQVVPVFGWINHVAEMELASDGDIMKLTVLAEKFALGFVVHGQIHGHSRGLRDRGNEGE